MKEMHCFDDLYDEKELSLLESYDDTSDSFELIKHKLIEDRYSDAAAYLQDANSLEEIIIINKAFQLGEEYAKAIKDDLDIEEKKVALYGFTKELNVIKQIHAGESLDNLILLIDAQEYEDFILMDYFDQTGSFINYPAVKKFLISKKIGG